MKKLLPLSLILAAILLVLLFFAATASSVPILGSALNMLVILYQILVPVEIIDYLKLCKKDFNIYAHGLESSFDRLFLAPSHKIFWPPIKKELKSLFWVMLATFVPYIFFYMFFFKWRADTLGQDFILYFNLPPNLFLEIIMQIFLVALPEEMFFRGFLQSSLLKSGLGLTLAIVLTNIIFAISHLALSLSPARLLTFFPGLIFSYLVYKNKSLLSPILYHAACNILGQFLFASVFLR